MSAAQQEFNELMRDKEKRTRHPEDDDDAQSFLNLSDDEDRTPHGSDIDEDRPDAFGDSAPRPSATIPRTRYGANTGPKGVISDAQNFRDSRRQHRRSLQQQRGSSTRDQSAPGEKFGELEEEDSLDDELDDDFMAHWRRDRLRELQSGKADSQMHTHGRNRRQWGGLPAVDGEGYLEAIDRSPPDTVVVVYIFDAYSEVSNAIEECIRSLARRHLDTRFVKLNYNEAEMEPAGVPALIAYRGGDKFAGLVPIFDELPDDADLSDRTLEAVLKRHQILR